MNYFEEHSFSKNTSFGLVTYSNFCFKIDNKVVNNNRAINNDIVYYENDKIVGIKSRNMCNIAGILYLNKNTKYGFSIKIFDGEGNHTHCMELTPNRAKDILKILKEKRKES